jgi:hypothetical protein
MTLKPTALKNVSLANTENQYLIMLMKMNFIGQLGKDKVGKILIFNSPTMCWRRNRGEFIKFVSCFQ